MFEKPKSYTTGSDPAEAEVTAKAAGGKAREPAGSEPAQRTVVTPEMIKAGRLADKEISDEQTTDRCRLN